MTTSERGGASRFTVNQTVTGVGLLLTGGRWSPPPTALGWGLLELSVVDALFLGGSGFVLILPGRSTSS